LWERVRERGIVDENDLTLPLSLPSREERTRNVALPRL